MNVLLDSHVFIWLDMNSSRLSATVRNYLTDPNNRLYFSVASVWEIGIKLQLNKLQLTDTLEVVLQQQLIQNTIATLDITTAHALASGTLPLIHKDPFDRMLIAQALVENAVILTDDHLIKQYAVRTDW